MALLRRVTLENFGCFSRASLELAPLSVLVGPNDAGKTTLLNGILAHHLLATGQVAPQDDLAVALGMPALLWHGAAPDARCALELTGELTGDEPVAFTSTAHLTGDRAGWRLTQQDVHIAGARWSWHGHSARIAISMEDDDDAYLGNGPWVELDLDLDYAAGSPWSEGFAHDIGQLDASHQGWLEAFLQLRARLRNQQVFRLGPAALRAPSPPARADEVPMLAPDGAGLPTLLSMLAGTDRQRLDAIETALVAAVPALAGLHILPTPEGHHRLVFTLAGSRTRVEASQVSDGVLLLLGYLSVLHHPRPPALLLLEEPAQGMHPRWLGHVVGLLRALTTGAAADNLRPRPATQVIVTTHVPALLDHVGPGEAFFLRRDQDGAATATRFDAIPDIDERLRETTLGALWRDLGEDGLHRLIAQERSARARPSNAVTHACLHGSWLLAW